jgi:hypothetical protein
LITYLITRTCDQVKKKEKGTEIHLLGTETPHPILEALQHNSSAAFLMYVDHIQGQFLDFSKIRFGKLLTQLGDCSGGGEKDLKFNLGYLPKRNSTYKVSVW